MHTYQKGATAERELVHLLYSKGWSVMRAPRSGRIGIPSPDVVAAKTGRIIVIEAKSRAAGFKIENDQIEQLQDWQTRALAEPYIGWKIARKGWFFLRLADVIANGGNIGKRFLDGRSLGIDEL